jgi:RNA polymerase sigma factor (sigma-70 family)
MIDPERFFRGWVLPPEYQIDPREHMGLVPWCLGQSSLLTRELPRNEVWQIAWETFLRCCTRCDNPETWAAYVLRSIRGSLKNARRHHHRVTRPGFSAHGKVRSFVSQEHKAGTLTLDGVRARFAFLRARPDADVARVVEWCLGRDASVEAVDVTGRSLLDRTADPDAPDPMASLESSAWLTVVEGAADRLPARERVLLERRVIGDTSDPANSQVAIGAEWGVSRQRVEQIERRAVAWVAEALSSRGLDGLSVLRPSQRARVLAAQSTGSR